MKTGVLTVAAILAAFSAGDAAAQQRTRPYAVPSAFGAGAPVGMTDAYRATILARELGAGREVAQVAAAARVRVPLVAYGGGGCCPARVATPIDQWIAQLDGISAR